MVQTKLISVRRLENGEIVRAIATFLISFVTRMVTAEWSFIVSSETGSLIAENCDSDSVWYKLLIKPNQSPKRVLIRFCCDY